MYNAMKTPIEIEIINFLKKNIEPFEDSIYGKGYKASATLKDGTFLPCVIFRNPNPTVNLAIKRFKEEQNGKGIFSFATKGIRYRKIVETFVTNGNNVNFYDIIKVEKSRFAIPKKLTEKITGETAMSWTAFVAEFKNGEKLSFGTTWSLDFFNLPKGFEFDDVEKVYNNSYLSKIGEIIPHKSMTNFEKDTAEFQKIFRERQSFDCFVENL